MKHTVKFQPSGRRGDVPEGATLLDAARAAGEPVHAACGGQGVCGKCRVFPYGSELGPASASELKMLGPDELAAGLRLACRTQVRSDMGAEVPEGSGGPVAVVLGADASRVFPVEPAVRNLYIELAPPSASDNTADAERVAARLRERYGLGPLSFGIGALRALHSVLTEGGWKLTATLRRDEVVRVLPGYRPRLMGAAFDVGTTTVAATLCDLETGETLATGAMTNPQVVMGDDVLSRVSYAASHEGGLEGMRGLIIDGLNSLLNDMLGRAGLGEDASQDVMEAVLVGNTVMHHILLGLPLDALGVSPFTPALSRAVELPAGEAGLGIAPEGLVYIPPVVGGFIGPDTTAVIAAARPAGDGATTLVADIGTNGELVLFRGGAVTAASCATGPAFEGAQISCGMRAAPGAIERAVLDPDSREVSYKVVGKEGWSRTGGSMGARGICGSGTLDLVAQMRRAGVLDERGSIIADSSRRVRLRDDGEREFVVAYADETATGRDITITQSDVRAVQLAKAAVAAGIGILLSESGAGAPDTLVVAGAFGNYLDVWNAAGMGMFPGCRPQDAVQAGNAAGDGARALLLSAGAREDVAAVVAGIRYIELSTHPDFQQRFMEAMELP